MAFQNDIMTGINIKYTHNPHFNATYIALNRRRKKYNTFKFFTVVYTCSDPQLNKKYSQARSYACQGGSMLRNLSPGTPGTMSDKFPIY